MADVVNEVVKIASNSKAAQAGIFALVYPWGGMGAALDPTTMLNDTYEGAALDTARWGAAKVTGGGAVTVSGGSKNIAPGATANAYAGVQSVATFPPLGAGFCLYAEAIQLPAAWPVHTRGMWGNGIIQGAPTAAAPVTESFCFGIDPTTGVFRLEVWKSGRVACSPIAHLA